MVHHVTNLPDLIVRSRLGLLVILVVAILGFIFATADLSDTSAQDNIQNASRASLRDTPWPAPAADLWRSGAAVDAGLPENVNDDNLVTESAQIPSFPFFGVTYDDETVFVLGGSPFLLELFTAAYLGDSPDRNIATYRAAFENYVASASIVPTIAKVDTATMEVETLELSKGSTVNYIGGIVAHENGMLYVVATSTLFEIDPETLTVTNTLDLPQLEPDPLFTTYNGLQVSPSSGDIILKMADFSGQTLTGVMLSVDTNDLSIRSQSPVQAGTSRMSVAIENNTEYVYLPGPTETLRYIVTDQGFALDEDWVTTYRSDDDGSTQGPAMLYMGSQDSVVFSSNGTIIYGVTAPLTIYSQPVTDTTVVTETAVSTSNPGGTFAGVPGDPFESGIFVVQDSINGLVAGWQLGQDSTFSKIWESDKYLMSAGPAVAVDQGHVYMDHRECDEDNSNCTYFLIVLDLTTGEEIARTEVTASLPTVGHIFVGKNDVFYIATEAGKQNGILTRVSVR